MLGEFEIIRRYLAPLANNPCSLGLADDVAVLNPPSGQDLIATKDILVAGVHFFSDDSPESIAQKAIRVNLSDLAAKGAKPAGYMLGLGLPAEWKEEWLDSFCKGLGEDQKTYGIDLLGGDTIRHPCGTMISITMIGYVPSGQATKRSSATVGDRVYVTGTIGDAALGYAARIGQLPEISQECKSYLLNRYLLPNVRIDAIQLIRQFANASIDISDGLVADLGHLCSASCVGVRISTSRLPIADSSRIVLEHAPDKLADILTGGDDYELLMTVADSNAVAFERNAESANIPVSEIGFIFEGRGVEIEDENGKLLEIDKPGYAHF